MKLRSEMCALAFRAAKVRERVACDEGYKVWNRQIPPACLRARLCTQLRASLGELHE